MWKGSEYSVECRRGGGGDAVLVARQLELPPPDLYLARCANTELHLAARYVENLELHVRPNQHRFAGAPPHYEHAVASAAGSG